MEPSVTQENLYLLLPFKVTQLALLYVKKFKVGILDAIKTIYRSNTYKEMEKEETKLWHLGPVALMEYLEEHK